MLSSRYLHLHEALGLGPMWLKHGAKSLPKETSKHTPIQVQAVTPPPERAAISAHSSTHDAAMNAIAKLSTNTQAPNTPAAEPADIATPKLVQTTTTNTVQPASLMIISVCASLEDQVAGQLFSGSVGTLLDNILTAIQLPLYDAHRSCWIKSSNTFNPQPDAEELAAALPALEAELAATKARAVLFLGQIFEHPDHQTNIQILCGERPFFIIPHPARLLRQPILKAQAWAVLKELKIILKPLNS